MAKYVSPGGQKVNYKTIQKANKKSGLVFLFYLLGIQKAPELYKPVHYDQVLREILDW